VQPPSPHPTIATIDVAPLVAEGWASPGARPVLEAMHAACSEVGFMAITGHGVPLHTTRALIDAAHHFFALPEETRLGVAPERWNPAAPNRYRGYFPSSAQGKEGLDIGEPALPVGRDDLLARPYYESNRFPKELGDAWTTAISNYFDALARLGGAVMEGLVAAAGGDPACVANGFDRPRALSTLRFNYYPRLDAPPAVANDGTALACDAHVDSGLVTILYQADRGGLQVRDRSGRWLDVPSNPESFVVNTGLALEHMTQGRFAATRHRVLFADGERLSIPFFLEPAWDFEIAPRSLGLEGESPDGDASYEAFLRTSLAKFPEYDRDD
jgi:isopenicillin N synthase-like dioxygenase